jgi:hypothetical protein
MFEDLMTGDPDAIIGTEPWFDRPQLALANLLGADPEAALQALISPHELPPTKRKTIAAKLGIDGTVLETLVNITATPLMLLGLIGTLRSRRVSERDVARFAKLVKPGVQRHLPHTRFARDALTLVEDTPLAQALPEVSRRTTLFQEEWPKKLYEARTKLQKSLGKATTISQEELITIVTERSFDPKTDVNAIRLAAVAERDPVAAAEMARNLTEMQARAERAFRKLPRAFQTFLREQGAAADEMYAASVGNPELGPFYASRAAVFADSGGLPGVARHKTGYVPRVQEQPLSDWAMTASRVAARMMAAPQAQEAKRVASAALPRRGVMVPDFAVMEKYGATEQTLRGLLAETARHPDNPELPLIYTMNNRKAWDRTIHQMSLAKGFSVPGREVFTHTIPDVGKMGVSPVSREEVSLWRTHPEGSEVAVEKMKQALSANWEDALGLIAYGYRSGSARGVVKGGDVLAAKKGLDPATGQPYVAKERKKALLDMIPKRDYQTRPELHAAQAGRWMKRAEELAAEPPSPDQRHELLQAQAKMHRHYRSAYWGYRQMGRDVPAEMIHGSYAKVHPAVKEGIPVPKAGGDVIREGVEALLAKGDSNSMTTALMLRDQVIPLMMGGLTPKQLVAEMKFNATKEAMAGWLEKTGAKLGGSANKVAQDWSTWIRESAPGWKELGHKVTHAFTLSTLGFPNITASIKNLMQVPVNQGGLGIWTMSEAGHETHRQLTKYVVNRLPVKLGGRGLEPNEAAKEALGWFYKMQVEHGSAFREKMQPELESLLSRVVRTTRLGQAAETGAQSLMAPFAGTELFNKLYSFNSAQLGLRRLLPGTKYKFMDARKEIRLPSKQGSPLVEKAAAELASDIQMQTQFGSGPLNKPSGTLDWWSPLSQYTTFPLRQFALLTRMWRYPGWMARSALVSGATYGILKHGAGYDISESLLLGGLPEATENLPFSPVPVSPFLQTVGAAGQAAVTGNADPLRRALPALVPGGVGLAKLLAYAPGVGRTVGPLTGRKYADYAGAVEGRVPVYTADGSLTGYYRPIELLSKSLGLADLGPQQESVLAAYLLRQRDSMRAMRREYLDALYQGDGEGAAGVLDEWQRKFPGMGGLPVSGQDRRAAYLRHQVTRLEKLLETMPPSVRPQYSALVGDLLGPSYPGVMGLRGKGLAAGASVSLRGPYRFVPQQATDATIQGTLHGVKLRDRLLSSADQEARTQTLPDASPATDAFGFTPFGGL